MAPWSRLVSFASAVMRWWSREFRALVPGRLAPVSSALPKRRLVIAAAERFVQISLQSDDRAVIFSEEIAWAHYSRDALNRLLREAAKRSEPHRCVVSLALSKCVSHTLVVPQKAYGRAYEIICDEVRRKTPLKLEDLFIGFRAEPRLAEKVELRYLVAPRTLLERVMTKLHLAPAEISLLETMPPSEEAVAAVAYRKLERRSDLFRMAALGLAGVTVASLCLAAGALYVRQAVRIADMSATAERLATQARSSNGSVRSLVDSIDDARRLAAARQGPGAVAIWAELTQALSDETYLTELVVDENSARLSGFSDSVADVMSALEASPMFARPTLSGPMTRQPDSRKQSFVLAAALRQSRIPDGGPDR